MRLRHRMQGRRGAVGDATPVPTEYLERKARCPGSSREPFLERNHVGGGGTGPVQTLPHLLPQGPVYPTKPSPYPELARYGLDGEPQFSKSPAPRNAVHGWRSAWVESGLCFP